VVFWLSWSPSGQSGSSKKRQIYLYTLVGEKTKLDLVEWMRNDENSRDLSIRSCEKN